MKSKLDEAMEIASMNPLPDDAEERIEKLAKEEKDETEAGYILSLLEAIFVQRNKP